MKKLYPLLSVLFLIYWGCDDEKEEVPIIFSKTFGGNENCSGYSVQQTTDGGYIITGTKSGSDVWLIKTDSNGDEVWNKTIGGNNGDYGKSVKQTDDGGYIITGSKYGDGLGGSDVWLIKTDSNGDVQWSKIFGGSGHDNGKSVIQTDDGGYIITGSTRSFGNGSSDIWLIKTNQNGDEEWNETFGGSNSDYGYSVQQTTGGGYIITGKLSGGGCWLIKTDPNGDEIWNKNFNGDYGRSVQQTTDGGYIITLGEGSGLYNDVLLIKTDPNGDEIWNKTFVVNEDFHSGNVSWGESVQQTTDGGYIITGGSYNSGFILPGFLIKTDSQGNKEWDRKLDEHYHGIGHSVQQTTDDGYIIVGTMNMIGDLEHFVCLIKTDSEGNTVPIGD